MTSDLQQIRRRLRILAILSGAQRAALAPLEVTALHTIAYLADALAPVWDLRTLDARLLKRRSGPFSPAVQVELDRLVGNGLVTPSEVRYSRDADGAWRIYANYQLNQELAARALGHALTLPSQAAQIRFVEEIVLAVAALGPEVMAEVSAADAAYGDIAVMAGRMVDVGGRRDEPNVTARVALRFGQLAEPSITLTAPELIHLYVRELGRRLRDVA